MTTRGLISYYLRECLYKGKVQTVKSSLGIKWFYPRKPVALIAAEMNSYWNSTKIKCIKYVKVFEIVNFLKGSIKDA